MDAEAQLDAFIAKYTPEIGAQARSVIERMTGLFPQAHRLVYDNYNALAIGFGPDARTSNAIFSIAIYPRWISLFFLQGVGLSDPAGLLKGSGSVVRHIVLGGPDDLDRPAIRALMDVALASAKVPLPGEGTGELIIKSVSARQRPRRPG